MVCWERCGTTSTSFWKARTSGIFFSFCHSMWRSFWNWQKKKKRKHHVVVFWNAPLILDLNQNAAIHPAVWPQRCRNIPYGLASSPKPKQHVFCCTADGGLGSIRENAPDFPRSSLAIVSVLSEPQRSDYLRRGQEREREREAAHALKTEESYGVWGWSRWRSEFNK